MFIQKDDQPARVVAAHHENKAANKRLIRRLRAASARHKIELLHEEQLLHDQLSDVWDEDVGR